MEAVKSVFRTLKLPSTGQSQIVLIGATVGIGIVGYTIWSRRKESIPKKWKRVGELSDLMCFPIKSCGVIRENEMECTLLGVRKGNLRDRVFMIIDLSGTFITGRQQPSLVKISPTVSGNTLTLSAPGMMDHVLDIDSLHRKGTIGTSVWGQKVRTVDCGEEAARWLSRFILSEDTGLRLVYYPNNKPTRDVRDKFKVFKKMSSDHSGALSDSTSFLLISESSVADLNLRLEKPVTPQHFRPNFVVKGSNMYDEDNWEWIKIGKQAVFKNLKPTTRCIFTTVDPETGIKCKKIEPLKTLKEYRQVSDPDVRAHVGDSPIMGINLGLRHLGNVKLGDSVYVAVQE